MLHPEGKEEGTAGFILYPDPTVSIIPDPVLTSASPCPGITWLSKKKFKIVCTTREVIFLKFENGIYCTVLVGSVFGSGSGTSQKVLDIRTRSTFRQGYGDS